MHEAPLTQEAIDHGTALSNSAESGLYAKLGRHPYLTGGALLASAGVAFAATKLAMEQSNDSSEVASKRKNPRSTTKRRTRRSGKTNASGRWQEKPGH